MYLRRKLLTRLLHLDRPIEQRSGTEIEAEVLRNYRWNFTVNVLDGLAFWFGFAFVSSTTIIPLYVSKVTLNPLVIGFVAMLAQSSWYLPQLLSAGATERIARKKPIVVNLGFFLERLPAWLWPLSALLVIWSPVAGLTLFIITYAWHGLGAGLVAPAWHDLLARIIPIRRRGRMFGLTTFLGTGAAAAGALLSGWLLERYEYPFDFTLIFLIAAAAITLSWVALALTREPAGEAVPTPQESVPLWPRMMLILNTDINFRRFLIVRLLLTLATMGLGFITVSAVENLGVQDRIVGLYTVTLLLGQTVGSLVSGLIADRMGHKVALVMGAFAAAIAFTVIVIAPTHAVYFAVFALIGFSIGVNIVSGVLISMEFSPASSRPTYVGLANSTVGIAAVAAPLLGGWLALGGYVLAFGASAIVGYGGLLLLLFWIRDPRHMMVESALADPEC